MKKMIFLVFIALVGVVFLNSCQKVADVADAEQVSLIDENGISDREAIYLGNIGELHNFYCAKYIDLYDSDEVSHTPALIFDRVKGLIESDFGLGVLTLNSEPLDVYIRPISDSDEATALLLDDIKSVESLLPEFVDRSFLTEFKSMIENNVIDIERLELLANSNAGTYYDKEMQIGMVNVLRESTEFWTGEGFTPVTAENIGKRDCLGYLWGWAYAVYEDSKKEGGLKQEGQHERMTQGLWAAAAFSLGVVKLKA